MEKPTLTFALAACFASFALFAAGCGGDDESSSQTTTEAPTEAPTGASTDEWADSFCSALTTWKNDLEEAAEPLTDLSSLSEESLQQAADDAKTATETLSDSLNGLGRPDISSGEQVRTSVQDLATDVENGAGEARRIIEYRRKLSGELRAWLQDFGMTPKSRADFAQAMAGAGLADQLRRIREQEEQA